MSEMFAQRLRDWFFLEVLSKSSRPDLSPVFSTEKRLAKFLLAAGLAASTTRPERPCSMPG